MLNFLKQLLVAIQPLLIKYLQTAAIKAALKLLFKAVIPNKLQVWLIKIIIKEIIIDEVIDPLVKIAFRESGYLIDKKQGDILVKKLKKASDNNDQIEHDNTIDDILK